MLFNWVILIWNWIFRRKPIIMVIINDGINNEIIKHGLKIAVIPKEGEIIYFKSVKPYYMVTQVMHDFTNRHYIWIAVEIHNI